MDSVWSNDTQRYTVTVENEKTKERTQISAAVMFYATGGFETPFFPADLEGLETFKGELFHSARWRHDVSLQEKKVGVIGNGCSAYVSQS
jgi:cation diffusion facilitator CzcD-associated flavoprotein CzcO